MADLLNVEGLSVEFRTGGVVVPAVEGVSLAVGRGETLGIVGESGAGKTATALSIMGLLDPPGRVTSGRVLFEGEDLLALPEREMRRRRGRDIAMVFQEPMTALNPVFTIGEQIAEAVRTHRGATRRQAMEASADLLRQVGIPEPGRHLTAYPHQLSGGMRQRATIAMALAGRPKLLIADEPTTALDVTIQAQILALLNDLRQALGMAVIVITHDLGVVAETADRVVVMYSGRVLEEAGVEVLFGAPCHPYTEGLMRAAPRLDARRRERLQAIPGTVPDPLDPPPGCRFAPRCPHARRDCALTEPDLRPRPDGDGAYRCLVPPKERRQEAAS